MSDRRVGALLAALFAVLATLSLGVWNSRDANQVTGDEPHYLVIADGIIDHRTLEQSAPYGDEFATNDISANPLAPSGANVTERNTHAVEGPRGWFNVHNIGLPVVLAVPFAIGGVVGAKLALIAIGAAVIMLCWLFSSLLIERRSHRLIAVGVAAIALPLIPASSQVYPEVPAAAIALAAIARLAYRRGRRADFQIGRLGALDWMVLIAVALLPWFHLRFGPIALLLAAVLYLAEWAPPGRRSTAWIKLVAPFAASLIALLCYNWYAFDNVTGPYSSGAVEFSRTSARVLIGLYVDQFQGMFVQNPALLIGLAFLPGFIRRDAVVGWTLVAVHVLFIIPNALHVNWYGGASFGGRFGVSAALVALPVAIFAIGQLLRLLPRATACGVIGILVGLQVFNFVRYTFTDFALVTDSVIAQRYQSFSPLPNRWPPQVDRVEVVSSYLPELAGAVVVAIVFGIGLLIDRRPERHRTRTLLVGVVPVLTLCAFATGSVAAFATSIQPAPIDFSGGELQTTVGAPVLGLMIADDRVTEPGVVLFGPAVPLSPGRYDFDLRYQARHSSEPSADPVASWMVTSNLGTDIEAGGELLATNGIESFHAVIDVDADQNGARFEFPVNWWGDGQLIIWQLTITRLGDL